MNRYRSLTIVVAASMLLAASTVVVRGGWIVKGEGTTVSKPLGAPGLTLVQKVVLASNRHNQVLDINAAELYLMNPDGSGAERLTETDGFDVLATISPNRRGTIVFDSNRNRTSDEPVNTSDLFLMNADGSEQTLLTRGSSATWSPDSKRIAFHRSASGTGLPVKLDPGAPATDSVIFIVNVDDLLQYGEQPTQVTFPLAPQIDDDADWSPDATKIVFTRKNNNDPNPNNPASAEIYVLDLGTGAVERLTDNGIEERSPAWSPDGRTLTYSCRTGIRGGVNLEICVMDVATRVQTKLTDNAVADLGPHWSPDGAKIIFQSQVTGQNEIWTMNPDGSQLQQITFYPQDGHNIGPAWGEIQMGGVSH